MRFMLRLQGGPEDKGEIFGDADLQGIGLPDEISVFRTEVVQPGTLVFDYAEAGDSGDAIYRKIQESELFKKEGYVESNFLIPGAIYEFVEIKGG